MSFIRNIFRVLIYCTLLGAMNTRAQVIISEFMAANSTGIRDEDGVHSDWLELFNTSSLPISLDGWFLADNALSLAHWWIPEGTVLQGNSYLLLWASGKDRTNPLAPLHTNFKISKDGGYLALVDPLTNVVSVFESYPVQTADVSYGRDRADPNVLGFFTTPTPSAQNAMSGPGFALPPVFSYRSGIYTNDSISLVITSSMGTIRYTMDGSVPASNSPPYAGPLILSTNVTVKARVFPPPDSLLFPSEVVAKNYLFLDGTTADFSSNLPLLIISTEGKSIGSLYSTPGSTRTNGTLTIINGGSSRTSLGGLPTLQVEAGFEYYGNSSVTFAKKPIRFETEDALGNNIDVSILGLPAGSDFKLKGPYDDKTMLNDFLAEEMFEGLGHYSVRRRFVEAFVDTGGGRINYSADYYGILVLLETIKIDKNRVDIPHIPTTATNEPTISGGYIFKKDIGDNLLFFTAGTKGIAGQRLAMHDPKPSELRAGPGSDILTSTGSNRVNYLRTYLNRMEQALYSNERLTATGTNHYSYYLDVDSFVDWHWIVEFPKQADGYDLSTYFQKDREGKIRVGPVWDFNQAFGNYNYDLGGQTNGWRYEVRNDPWLSMLVSGDPDFAQKIADRWGVLRTNVFNSQRVIARIEELASYLDEAANRDLAKYKTLGAFVFGNPDGGAATAGSRGTVDARDVDFVRPLVYSDHITNSIIGQMKRYVFGRYLWIDSQFTPPPTIHAADGLITNGFIFSIDGKPGIPIYYTTDGTDPRGPGGVTNGILYTGPIAVSGNMGIVSRSRETNAWKSTWSGPSRVTLYTSTPSLRITEIMYHPDPPPLGSTNSPSDFEYVEVKNIGSNPLNVSRFSLSGGIDFIFPNVALNAGESAVIVKDLAAFQSRYGTNNPNIFILGVFRGQLDDAGDHLVLRGGVGEPILDFSYADNWFPATDGLGFSLVRAGDESTTDEWGLASKWRPSAWVGGSPGQDELVHPVFQKVLLNEVLAHSQPAGDAIELYNPNNNTVDLGGWFLSDDFATPRKCILPPGTIIPALGYLVLYETNTFNFPTNAPTSFALGAKGDDIWLFSGDGTNLTGYADGFTFGASPLGRTFGRYMTSDGTEHFVLQSSNSLDGLNSGPSVGPLVISEINADPVDHHSYPGDEYIELQNITAENVPLYDPAYPTNTWRLQDAVSYSFPRTNVIVPPGGILLLVSFDPEAEPSAAMVFRERNAVPANVPLFGPWTGTLDNTSDNVLLMRPDQPDLNGSVAYFIVDWVKYSNKPPWPNLWNGTQLSLQRRLSFGFGNDPTNWVSVGKTAGTGFQPGGALPMILSQPNDLIAPTGRPLLLSVGAVGSDLHYQWERNGSVLLGETNATLIFSNFQAQHIGTYNIIVYNSAGGVLGNPFDVSFRFQLRIVDPPRDRLVFTGGTTNFRVFAGGQGPVIYQWMFNGANVAADNVFGGTTTSLIITNVQPVNEGIYTVSVRDDYETQVTDPARLTIIFKPVFTLHPLSQKVVQGGSVTLSAAAAGTTPMTFRWRKQTNTFAYSSFATNTGPAFSFVTITNFQLSDVTNYNVVLSNVAGFATGGPLSGTSSNAFLTFLADSDHDGLPDQWENGRNGFSSTDPNDALRDDDGDGMSNLAEFLAGTDYLDPLSYLKVNIAPAGATISFSAISNRTYSILYGDTPASTVTQKLFDVPALPSNSVRSFVDPNPSTKRFYRLATPRQP
jgi:hypothetical protein